MGVYVDRDEGGSIIGRFKDAIDDAADQAALDAIDVTTDWN